MNIGLLGFGTIGTGVYELINLNKGRFAKNLDEKVVITKILDKDPNKKVAEEDKVARVVTNPDDIMDDPEIEIVIALLGGMDFEYGLIKRALQSGKHVVTANKAVISEYFEELLTTGRIRCIRPSDTVYESRKNFGESQLGTPLAAKKLGGFRLLQGSGQFSGEILGGCIDSIFDMFDPSRYADMPEICRKYGLFPAKEEWRGRILLLESSEEQMAPAKYQKALEYLKDAGVFAAVSGVLVGRPMDGVWQAEYEQLLRQVIDDPALPVVCGLNAGHALPRCIVPFGVPARVDVQAQKIKFL